MSQFNEIKTAFGVYLSRYYNAVLPTHEAVKEWRGRGLSKSIMLVPDRMIDAVNDQLDYYRENSGKVQNKRSNLPVVFVAMAKDANMSMGEHAGNHATSPEYVTFQTDAQNRVFKMQTMIMERRVQLAFLGSEETSVRSLATQFVMWVARPENRRFSAKYKLIGDIVEHFPIMVESSESMAMNVALDQVNLTCLTIDLTLREAMPFVTTPEIEAGNMSATDSAGYGVVTDVVTSINDCEELHGNRD